MSGLRCPKCGGDKLFVGRDARALAINIATSIKVPVVCAVKDCYYIGPERDFAGLSAETDKYECNTHWRENGVGP